ncbi:MAG: RsmE family RNA methyltransferase [Candidatus Eiseniibacteriota bacterium]
MDRVFLSPECFSGTRAVVSGSERHHLADVLRVERGERFLATDGAGHEFLLQAERVDRHVLEAGVVQQSERAPGAERDLVLAIAPPRGGRMEVAVEKTVECGVGRIVPLVAARSVVKGRDDSERIDRWRRVARAAVAQSGRVHLPEIAPVCTLAEALAEAARGAMLFAHPALTAASVSSVIESTSRRPITIFVGPEGGFTDEELEEGVRAGAVSVSLGPTRLRTETAAIVAVTLALASMAENPEPRR